MGSRLDLQTMLENLLGSRNVYFQPPASMRLSYPAIVYSRQKIGNSFADNVVYKQSLEYSVIVVDVNPDSPIVQKVSMIPTCRFDRSYASDNLNHTVFTINF